MAGLFSYESPLIQFLNKIVDSFFLSVLWIVFSLPIITMGPATCALYYTANKVLRHNRSHILKEFWHSFKDNFKQGFIVGLGLIIFYVAVIQNIYLYFGGFIEGLISKPLLIFNVITGLIVLPWAIFIFSYIARFENKLKIILKNCLLISIRHIGVSFLLLLLLVVTAIIFWLYLPTIFLLPALYMLLATYLLEPVYRRYMSDEDLQAENERNMVYYN